MSVAGNEVSVIKVVTIMTSEIKGRMKMKRARVIIVANRLGMKITLTGENMLRTGMNGNMLIKTMYKNKKIMMP
jgi:hypothetical protein